MFANADSLFYYAREARLGKRLLSPEEIQALLSHARDSGDHTHHTSVSGHTHNTSQRKSTSEDEERGNGEGEGEEIESEEVRELGFDQSLGFRSCSVEEEKSRFVDVCLQMSGGFAYARGREECLQDDAMVQEEFETEPLVDHSDPCGGEGEVPTDSHTSVESWLAEVSWYQQVYVNISSRPSVQCNIFTFIYVLICRRKARKRRKERKNKSTEEIQVQVCSNLFPTFILWKSK